MKHFLYKHLMVLNSCLGSLTMGFLMVAINKGTTYPDEWQINISSGDENSKNSTSRHGPDGYDNIFVIDSILSAGGFAGSMLTGLLSWMYGRRTCLILSDIIILSAMLPALLTESISVFASMQFLFGIACGINCSLSYLYIREISTKNDYEHYRYFPQIFLTFGNLLAGLLWKAEPYWELMLLLPSIFAWFRLVMLYMFFYYDTPFYYIHKKEKKNLCKGALNKVHIFENLNSYEQIKKDIRQRDTLISPDFRIGSLLSKKLWKSTLVGFSLITINQTTGVNYILFFSGIFMKHQNIQNVDFIIVIINFLFSFSPLLLTKIYSKKSLMTSGLSISNFIIVLALILSRYWDSSTITICYFIMIIVFYFTFETSLAGLLLSTIADILPDIGVILLMSIHWIILMTITLSYIPTIEYFQGMAIVFSVVNTAMLISLTLFYDENMGDVCTAPLQVQNEQLLLLNTN